MHDKNYYYKLGQFAGFAICSIRRGPECFHTLAVKNLFKKGAIPAKFMKSMSSQKF